MTNEVIEPQQFTEETVIEPQVIEEEIPTPAPVELRYEYQPTDEVGRPIGGKQVIKYTSPGELAEKLTKQNVELLRKLRSETRKNRLGISEQEQIGDESPRFQKPVSFQERVLTPEEQFNLSRTLGIDPEDFDSATDALFEAKIGVTPATLRSTLADIQAERIAARAQSECNAFMTANPDYVKCPENFEAITNWMLRYDLAPVKANFQRAYDSLRAVGILVENITPDEVVETTVVEQEPVPIAHEAVPVVIEQPSAPPLIEEAVMPKPTVSRVPVGLNRSNSAETGVGPRNSGEDIVYEIVVGGQKRRFTGLAAVDAMSADEYRRRAKSDSSFLKRVEKLEAEQAQNRRNSRR